MTRAGTREAEPKPGYNERLFSGSSARAYYHLARFKWAAAKLAQLPPALSVVELGCFDGKLLDFVGGRVREYVGLDANWEGGLDLARKKFEGRKDVRLIHAQSPESLKEFPDLHFDAAVALETLEHVPPDLVDPYLAELARVTSGHLVVSVPNEMGAVFAAKYLAKRLLYGDVEPYTLREFMAATLKQTDKVARTEHKGFDYRELVRQIGRYFRIFSVEGLAGFGLPPSLSPTIGIVAVKRSD